MCRIPEVDLQKPICSTCGTQFDANKPPNRCHICDDPRQYVPPTGQSWTTLKDVQSNHKNIIEPLSGTDGEVYTIITQPRFPIGQRAHLIRTTKGNILWDLVALIDEETIEKITALGGLDAIVISHPHFYTTYATWSHAFGQVPVYIASEDERWLARRDAPALSIRRLITSSTQNIIPQAGVTAIKAGGHFPGSMVLHWKKQLFTADTIMVVPSGLYDVDRNEGTVAFAFMWSYPNMIPLPPDAVSAIIRAIESYDFDRVHGGFSGQDITRDAKRKLIESAKVFQGAVTGIQPGEHTKREFWK